MRGLGQWRVENRESRAESESKKVSRGTVTRIQREKSRYNVENRIWKDEDSM